MYHRSLPYPSAMLEDTKFGASLLFVSYPINPSVRYEWPTVSVVRASHATLDAQQRRLAAAEILMRYQTDPRCELARAL